MDLMEKEVCLICSSGNIILTFDTALSLLLEFLKTNLLYCVNENGLNNYINLVNKFKTKLQQLNPTQTIIIRQFLNGEKNKEN